MSQLNAELKQIFMETLEAHWDRLAPLVRQDLLEAFREDRVKNWSWAMRSKLDTAIEAAITEVAARKLRTALEPAVAQLAEQRARRRLADRFKRMGMAVPDMLKEEGEGEQ